MKIEIIVTISSLNSITSSVNYQTTNIKIKSYTLYIFKKQIVYKVGNIFNVLNESIIVMTTAFV